MNPFRIIAGATPGTDRGGWDSSGNVDIPGNISVAGTTSFLGGVVDTLALVTEAIGDTVLSVKRIGDAAPRWYLVADGGMNWGGGAGAADANLYRYAAGGLATDAALKLTGGTLLLGAAGDASLIWVRSGVSGTPNDFELTGAGKGINLKTTGGAARMGTAVLVAGTVTVATTAVTAVSVIMLSTQVPGGTPSALRVASRIAGTSFVVTSLLAGDTSTIAYIIFEPSA